jgi:hypothetical protein
MASKAQMTGMRGVYLTAAELSRLGFIASPTSRSAAGADLLVTNHSCSSAFSVQVKTNARSFGFWLVGEKALSLSSSSHIYVLVNIRPGKEAEIHEYFVVPSRKIARLTRRFDRANSTFFAVNRADVERYRNKWSVFGEPT